MKKNLIYEITRIKEIMGVDSTKRLILEANIIDDLLVKLSEFIKKNRPRPHPQIRNTYIVDNIPVRSSVYQDILNFIEKKISIANLSDQLAYTIGRILSQDQQVVDNYYADQIRKFMIATNATEKDALSLIRQEYINSGNNMQLTLQKLLTDPNDPLSSKTANLLSGLLEGKISKKLDDIDAKIYKQEVFKPEGWLKTLLKNLEPTDVKAFREIILKYWKKSKDDLAIELDRRFDLIREKLSRTTKDGKPSPEKIGTDMREIFNILAAWKKSAGDDLGELYRIHITDNPNIPQKSKDLLSKAGYVDEYRKYADEEINSVAGSMFTNALKRNLGTLNIIGAPIRKVLDKSYTWEKMTQDISNSLKRILNVVVIKTPALKKEILTDILRNGRFATLAEKALVFIVIHNVLIPWAIAVAEQYFKNRQRININKTIELVRELCLAGQLANCPSDDELQNIERFTYEEFNKLWKENIPMYKLFFGENGEWKWQDLLFFTYLDEVYNFASDLKEDKLFGDDEFFEKKLEKLKSLKNGANQWLKERGIDPEDQKRVEELKKLVSKKYEDSEDSFKEYIEDNKGYQKGSLRNEKNLKQGDLYVWNNISYYFDGETFRYKNPPE